MADILLLSITGRLTKDAVVKSFNNPATGKTNTKAEFSVAVSLNRKNPDGTWGEETSYFDCEYWCSPNLTPFLTKGRQVAISGDHHQENWTDQQGQNRKSWRVRVDNLILLAAPQSNSNPAPQNAQPAPAPQNQNYARPTQNYRQPAPQAPVQQQYAQPAPQPQYAQPAPQAPAQNVMNNFGGNPEDNIPF